jgi:hypothetical protein
MCEELSAPVSLRIDNNAGQYFLVSDQDLSSLIQAAQGQIADWDEFNHIVLEDEYWSHNWKKIELNNRCTVFDPSGIYFKGTNSYDVDYVTATLASADLSSIETPERAPAVGATAE